MSEPIARIEAALAQLGAEHEPPVGWEARVLAATAAPKRRAWWWWLGIPLVAVAVLLIALWRPQPTPIAQLDLKLDGGPVVRSSAAPVREVVHAVATLGQVVHATATGRGRYRAVWVFRNDRPLTACPGGAHCQGDRLELTLSSLGRYRVIALASSSPLPAPATSLDQALADARTAGADTDETELTVQ